MAHKIYWHNPNKKDIVRIDIRGVWTWKDYDELVLALHDMISSVEHRVDLIADLSEADNLPAEGDAAQHIKRGRQFRPENFGMTVNVGTNPTTKKALDTGVILSGRINELRPLVDTIEEAYEIITRIREGAV